MKNFKLNRENVLFLFIDIQDKLLKAIDNKQEVLNKSIILAKASNIMNIPTITTVQYPKGLGYSNEDLLNNLNDKLEIEKISFSCMLNDEFKNKITSSLKKQVVVCGIEAHICVFLTVRDLLEDGFEVFVVEDGIGSRDKNNKLNAIRQFENMGAIVTNVETVLFDLNPVSGTDEFKACQKLII